MIDFTLSNIALMTKSPALTNLNNFQDETSLLIYQGEASYRNAIYCALNQSKWPN